MQNIEARLINVVGILNLIGSHTGRRLRHLCQGMDSGDWNLLFLKDLSLPEGALLIEDVLEGVGLLQLILQSIVFPEFGAIFENLDHAFSLDEAIGRIGPEFGDHFDNHVHILLHCG
jgi:hypothetical protein